MRRRGAAALAALMVWSCATESSEPTTSSKPPPITTVPSTTSTSPSTTTASTTTTLAPGTAGSVGIGDELYPELGNGGYDVVHYRLHLAIDPSDGSLEGSAGITAKATHGLTRFNLDLVGLEVATVSVDGERADFARRDEELVVTPASVIPTGTEFMVEVAYAGTPTSATTAVPFGGGWQHRSDLVYVIDQPDGASTWFPVNDHPRDPATFTLTLDVPPGFETVTSGLPAGGQDDPEVADTWEIPEQTAPYLVALAVGQFQTVEQQMADGVSLIIYHPEEFDPARLQPFQAHQEMLRFFSERFGPYPYDRFGALIVDDPGLGAALETQTLATYGLPTLALGEEVVSHELAHQWFGNSVRLAEWGDIWLNEGFATFAQWLWAEERSGTAAYDRAVEEAYAIMSGAAFVTDGDTAAAAESAQMRFPPPAEPTAADLFNGSVYLRGGLALVGLRDRVGDEAMFGLISEWYRRAAGEAVTSGDFESLAVGLLGEEAGELLRDHLYDPLPPAMPERVLEPLQ